MKQTVLTILLALFSLSLIGAGNEGRSNATVATVVGSMDQTVSQNERKIQEETKNFVSEILRDDQMDLSSQKDQDLSTK